MLVRFVFGSVRFGSVKRFGTGIGAVRFAAISLRTRPAARGNDQLFASARDVLSCHFRTEASKTKSTVLERTRLRAVRL